MGSNPPPHQEYPPPPGGQGFPPSGHSPNYPPPPYTPSGTQQQPSSEQQPHLGEQHPPIQEPYLVQQQPYVVQQQPYPEQQHVYPMQGGQHQQQMIVMEGPPQLPPLVRGQKIKSGPYMITVTDEMVEHRERENQELYRAWWNEQQRRNMSPEEREQGEYSRAFKYAKIRRKFIRKVYCLLTLQLAFTACVIGIVIFIQPVQQFVMEHWYLSFVALFFFVVSYYAIVCYECARRSAPCNVLWLSVLTLSLSYSSAYMSAYYRIEIVLIAFGMTAAVSLIISLVAMFSKFDLTKHTGMILVITLVVMLAVIVMTIVLIFTRIRVLHVIISIIMTLLLSMYLFFDTQVIMGGRKVELSPDEVIYATTQLYVDIILLYQYILMCMGGLTE